MVFALGLLKLSAISLSQCIYLKLTFDHVNKIHENTFTHLSSTCVESCGGAVLLSVARLGPQSRLLATKKTFTNKKKNCKTTVSDEYNKKSKQMSESHKPTLGNTSHGGQFDISPTGSSSSMENYRKRDESARDNARKGPSKIPPDFRVWENVASDVHFEGPSMQFTIVSYNVLAQYLLECHPYLYTECNPHDLKWKVRAARIYDEIISLAPDIICLQEVQLTHLLNFFNKFEQIGYGVVYKQRTGHRHDGCAIYYKKSVFDILGHVSVEYYQPALPILNRDNIGLIVKLGVRGLVTTNRVPGDMLVGDLVAGQVVVATTHLLYNPARTDVRLAQIQLLLAEIDRFSYYSIGGESGHLPIILTGDLNSQPGSAVIKLLDQGHVSASPFRDAASDWKNVAVTDCCQHLAVYLNRQTGVDTDYSMLKVQNQEYGYVPVAGGCSEQPQFSVLFNGKALRHALPLASVFPTTGRDHHRATTYQNEWVTVDYIYYSCFSCLQLERRLRLPTPMECWSLGRLPNDRYGSDHLIMAASFRLYAPLTPL